MGAAPGSALEPPGAVLLISCYELGHQPFTVASPWAQLEHAGFGVAGLDTSLQPLDEAAVARARLVAISVPMHTAVRLGSAVAARIRAQNPGAHVCLFGLYAALNAEHLLEKGVADSVIGGEFESALVALASAIDAGRSVGEVAGVTTREGLERAGRDLLHPRALAAAPVLQRLPFVTPRRDGLPALDRYARLIGPGPGEERVVGYLEASRGCLHRCLHCPITPVYDGRFFIVPREVVLADAAQQVAAGARHLTFGDPDFFNGVGHSMAIARALHEAHPGVTFDVTTKVELILKHRERLAELRALGCVFVVSAVESLSARVLDELDKGHTRADVFEALRLMREAGIPLRPSLVAFTPWTTLGDYLELCDFIVDEGLEANVDPIQLAIRLLIPPGSALLARDDDGGSARRGAELCPQTPARPRPWLGALLPDQLGYRWTHPDPAMDHLHEQVSLRVDTATQTGEDASVTFAAIRALAYRAAGREPPPPVPRAVPLPFVPHLTEPWFCCAEPSRAQVEQVAAPPATDACGCG
jgi:radical SAM superfamily enzyme YgiQ (UPF0313 family)